MPSASTHHVDAVLGGVALVLHQHAVAIDKSDAIDGLGAAECDASGGGGFDFVVGAGGRNRCELQASLAENGRGRIEERPAAGLGAATDEDGETRGQFAGGVGVGGTSPHPGAGHVDAILRRCRLVFQQHSVACVDRDPIDSGEPIRGKVDVLNRCHLHRLLHGAAGPGQGVGGGIAGPRDERDAAGAAGRDDAAECDRRGVEVDVAVGGRDVARDRQGAG